MPSDPSEPQTTTLDAALVLTHEKTLRDLEWSRLVDALRARAVGPLRERLTELPLASTFEATRVALDETAEALATLRNGEPLPLSSVPDVRSSLARVEKLGVLEGFELRDVARSLSLSRVLRKFLAARKSTLPLLHRACPFDPALDALEEEISACIEPSGQLADHASPELRRLRTEVANLRARIVARLEQMLVEHASVVQDRFLTIRDGRYVVPVRTDAHDKIPGIVHGTSGSGATVFIEPRVLVDQQNRLTLAQGEMEAEERRILAQLSELVRERLPTLTVAVESIDHADLKSASARLADDLRAPVPTLIDAPRIQVTRARHPLLALDGGVVVANDLAIEGGHALVISGPNAGGKTVALKLLGMFALMVRAGLPVPASEGGELGFFPLVLSDVGDEQSMQKNLSTFSAHVTSLARILDLATTGALVLLDEVATGTDPGEGGALACAVVDALCRRGAAVGVTTHYEPLKAMATEDPRLRNASVGFDVERMAPTFHVRMDVPGASSALAVAARFGLDRTVIERARTLLPDQTRTFDALVTKLESQYELAVAERRASEAERLAATRIREDAERELAKIRERDRTKLSMEAERTLRMIRDVRDEVKRARAELRTEGRDAALIEAARSALERAQKRIEDDDALSEIRNPADTEGGAPVAAEMLVVGAKVYVPHLRAEMEIVEGPSRGRVRVSGGAVKLWLGLDEIRARDARPTKADAKTEPVEEAPRERRRRGAPAESAAGAPSEAPFPTQDNTIDLRGMRVDDALPLAEAFLDRVYGENRRIAYILHGVGTGALRDAVRARLRDSPRYVRRYRPGSFDEGGDRLTVVELS